MNDNMHQFSRPSKVLWPMLVALLLALIFTSPTVAQEEGEPVLIERIGVVRGQGALLLHETERTTKALLPAGSLVMLTARSEDGSLLFVESGEYGNGWVAAGSLLTVNTTELPARANSGTTVPITNSESASPPTLPTTETVADEAVADETVANETVAEPVDESTRQVAQVTLTDSRLNLRSGPGTSYPVVTQAQPGSEWLVIGRDDNGDWLALQTLTDGETLWGAVGYFTVDSTVSTLPVVAAPPLPTQATILQPTPVANPPSMSPATDSQPTNPPTNSPTNQLTNSPTNQLTNSPTNLTGTLVFNDRIGGTIYAYSLDTGTMWPVTTGIDPAISPDAQRVAFTRDGGGNGVYVINIDGSNERLLYGGHELLRSPKWSPDGGYIVFSRSNGHDDCRVLEGGICLPDDAILDSLPPELQTGEAVNAVRGLPNQRSYRTVLSRIGLDGEGYRDIPSLDYASAPDWTDAGIVYHASRAGIQQTADANVMSKLVVDDELHGYFLDPDWQPGGGQIAFYRKLGSHWQIHLVNPDGTGLTAITRPVTALVDELPSNVAPAWSPDGRHIVYVSNRNSIESAGAWHFWVMNADGSDQRMLPIDLPLEYTYSAEQLVSWGPATGQ